MITHDTVVNLNLSPGDQVEIEWVDARYLSGWHDRQEILSWERDFNKHHSTGFFAFANDENLLFAETWSPPGWELKSAAGINAIPLNAILNIWRLQRAPETVHVATFGIEETSFDQQSLATGMPGYRPEDRERVEYRQADVSREQVVFDSRLSKDQVGDMQPLSRQDARPPLDDVAACIEIAGLALKWRAAERAYQKALTEEHTSRIDDIQLSQVAGAASQALRVALDQRLAVE